MKTTWLILGLFSGLAFSSPAQTNEPVIQVKFYSDPNRTNKIHLFSTPLPSQWISCSVIGVFKSGRLQLMIREALDDSENGKLIILEGYPAANTLAIDDVIKIYAHQVGTIMGVKEDGTDMNGYVRPFWEYVDADAENLKQEREQERETALRIHKFQAERLKDENTKAAAIRQKNFLIQSNVVHWLQPQATNGSASAQCSLGVHYLNGQGCETNREQAIYWLKKAADQDDIEASNKLASLKP